MTDRRRLGTWAVGGMVVLGLACGLAWTTRTGRRAGPTATASAKAPGGLGLELKALGTRLIPQPEAPPDALTAAEASEACAILVNVRDRFTKCAPGDRVAAMTVAGKLLTRLGVDPAPPNWFEALKPVYDVLAAGLVDVQPPVRVAALSEVGRLWSWLPGLTPDPAEERSLDSWKQGFVAPAILSLASADVPTRASAVACLARLPLNDAAATAAAYVADSDPAVRQQALIGFAGRRDLLGEEAILPLLHDSNLAVSFLAARTLKARGLNDDQIAMGRLIAHPRPAVRASAIPQLLTRTDIDPVVWLVHLSRDPAESVRLRAVEALGTRTTPEALQRLAEIAQSDAIPAVRTAAAKFAPPAPAEATVSLPALPGSASLNPKAN